MPVSFWLDEELEFIEKNYESMTHQQMGDKIGKTHGAVKKKCRERGLIKKPHAEWTPEALEFLNTNWNLMEYKEIGLKLGMSEKMVFLRAQRLGFSKEVTVEIGDLFNRLTVIELPEIRVVGQYTKSFVKCECECGNITELKLSDLINGNTKSCGCWQKEVASKFMTELKTTHGGSNTKLYKNWIGLKSTALKEETEFYQDWTHFLTFKKWAEDNGYEDGITRFYRKDLSKGYNPENCAIRKISK